MPKTILHVARVIEAMDMYENGFSIKQIASTCGVGYEQARRIVRGKNWTKKIQKYKDQLAVEDVQ